MKNREHIKYVVVEPAASAPAASSPCVVPINSSRHFRVNSDEVFYDTGFLKQLRFEMLRAERSNAALSIILLSLDKETDEESTNLGEILEFVRVNTRDIDIRGFVNDKTIAILLPYTDEKGAKEICGKLMNGNQNSQFSTTIATYPDQIFESLVRNGCVRSDAFLFDLYDSMSDVSWIQSKLKIGFDLIGSIICILMFMPIMLITALVVKITSPGPIIFKQLRLGKQGIPFTFYKFRSMYVNMDDRIHREYTEELISGDQTKINNGDVKNSLYKMESDPRITKVGKFIRKTSIDELPQLFNVLKGDMSLVGPRPPLSYEVEKYKSWHLMRILEMKPGITGLWQVEGRSMVGWDDSVRLDIQYIKNWSLIFDFKILLRTVRAVLSCKGAT